MNKAKVLALAFISVLIVAACAPVALAPMATPSPVPTEPAKKEGPGTIVDVAINAGNFETLVKAVSAAGLAETLKGEGPFTVFAPTDEAFAALPEGTLKKLLADPEGELKQILLYHVVAGKVMSTDLKDGMTTKTLQGSSVTFSIKDGVVKVNNATVVTADIEASNGVIHVIDTVILPPSM